MERKILNMLSLAFSLMLLGCSANPASDGKVVMANQTQEKGIYDEPGMEISKIVSKMTDTLYQTMVQDIQKDSQYAQTSVDKDNNQVVTYQMPKVAVTSFVDTDSYQKVGYLGRSVAEMFIHELDRRNISVFEYKLTGGISITQDGEFVFSRNWKKVARQAMVKHIVAGTFTRNDKGIVVVGRVINMQNSTVVGSTTGFIPYKYLPYCYQSSNDECQINGILSYVNDSQKVTTITKNGVKDTVVKKSVEVIEDKTIVQNSPVVLTKAQRKALKEAKTQEFIDNNYHSDKNEFNQKYYGDNVKIPATSTGNYEKFVYQENNSFMGNQGADDAVVYPADSYLSDKKLVRDVHDQSQYSRVR